MKHNIRVILSCLFSFAVLAACRPSVDLTPINPLDGWPGEKTYITESDSYADIFKTFWQGMDTNYVYWDVEPTGYWDDVWNSYKPKFEALGTYSAADIAQVTIAKQYIMEMVTPLKDGHLTVDFEDTTWYFPSMSRVNARYLNKDPNTDPKTIFHYWVAITEAALKRGFEKEHGANWLWADVSTGESIRMATGTIPLSGPGHIRYLYTSGFHITENFSSQVVEILNAYVTDLSDPNCRGVIFDMRGNGGGIDIDVPLLLSPLLASNLHFANMRIKKGAGRLNYSAWAPYILKANAVGNEYRALNAGALPVVALINDYSISNGELMPMAVKAMPTGHLIGTRTWGATGPRRRDETPVYTHGGSFSHNKLWTGVVEAGYQIRGLHFESYEGDGVPPDQWVEFDLSSFNDGTDVQLEAAIQYVEDHQ